MFVDAAVLLLPFSFALLWTKVQVQECQSCNSSCYWDSCCEMKCTDYCNHTFSCQIHDKTNTAGDIRWCTVEVNDPLIIIITFSSSSACTVCTNGSSMCCDSGDTVLRINCSTVSTVLTPSSQSSAVTPPVSSIQLSLSNTHFTASTTNSVLATSPIVSLTSNIIVPAVVGTALILLVVITLVIVISCILVVIHKKHSKGKQMKAQKQNWNMDADMTECEAYGKLEVNSEKIDMKACSAYGTLQTLQNAVDPEYEDVTAI